MRFLLDTHTLLWAAKGALPRTAKSIIEDTSNILFYSSANLWEIELKRSKLNIDTSVLHQNLLDNGYNLLTISATHVLGLAKLPNLHSDPFDRILLSQAICERMPLLTADKTIQQYSDYLDCVVYFE